MRDVVAVVTNDVEPSIKVTHQPLERLTGQGGASRHTVTERLARWMLHAIKRLQSGRAIQQPIRNEHLTREPTRDDPTESRAVHRRSVHPTPDTLDAAELRVREEHLVLMQPLRTGPRVAGVPAREVLDQVWAPTVGDVRMPEPQPIELGGPTRRDRDEPLEVADAVHQVFDRL